MQILKQKSTRPKGTAFTDKYLQSLKPKSKKYHRRSDTGFDICVLPSGVKTFLYIYEVNGKRKQHNLGKYPHTTLAEARKKYYAALEAFHRGEPLVKPPAEEPPSILLIKGLISDYKQANPKDTRWAKTKASSFENKLKDWHDRAVESITKQDAIRRIEQERAIGDGAARNLNKIACALFQHAVDRDIILANPFLGIKKIIPAIRNKNRNRFLSEREIKTVWNGITTGTGFEVTQRALKLILVTAQRPGEVAGMHRREIDGDWWTIPAERAEKGGRAHRVFLTATAKELIGDGKGYIFPSPKKSESGHLTRIALSARVTAANCYGVPHWTPHDLRRTARTNLSRLGVKDEHAEAVLNHAKQGMIQVYNQYDYDNEKRVALERWEEELLALVGTP